jgi:UDP-glucose 4-epimerase
VKVLVVGGAGFLGSVVVHQLCRAGHDVTVCDNLSTGNAWTVPGEARFVPSDVTDARSLDLVMRGGYDAVAFVAGLSTAGASFREPLKYLRTNVGGMVELLTDMRENGIRRLVFASSAAVYGDPGPEPVSESAPVAAATPYACSLVTAEQAIGYEAMTSDLGAVTLRLFNVAGACGSLGEWHHPETHLVPSALQVAAGVRGALPVYGTDQPTPDGTAIRDFVHVGDAARSCLLALDATAEPGHRVYNIGSGTGHSVRAVLREVRAVSGYPIPTDEVGPRPWEPPVLVASIDRARHELGFVPRRSELHQIVEDAWTFLHGHLGCRPDLGSLVIA